VAEDPSRQVSAQDRAQRRRADRERLRQAAEDLLTPEGWLRWMQARSRLHGYSAANCMLIAQQCHERGIVPQHVAGLRAWRKLGRRVRKGETALRISAPIVLRCSNEDDERGAEWRTFKTAFVFELSQTEPLAAAKCSLELTCEPMNGSSHAYLFAPLCSFVESLGYTVSSVAISGGSRGWCDTQNRRIAIDANAPANAQVRTLIHECVHALGIDYERYPRGRAEVIADTVTFVACSSVGLRVDTESIPYVASWGADGALAAVTDFAQTIDGLARRIEDGALRSAKAPLANAIRPGSGPRPDRRVAPALGVPRRSRPSPCSHSRSA
jgi:hypothetical protein